MRLRSRNNQTCNRRRATAQEYATTKKAIGNPRPQMMRLPPAQSIPFNVAITATKGAKTHGGVVVFAGAFGLGSKGESERTDESVNRIQFSVPVWLPTGEYPGASMGAN